MIKTTQTLTFKPQKVWSLSRAHKHLLQLGLAHTPRTSERRLHKLGILPTPLNTEIITDEFGHAPNRLVFDQIHTRSKRERCRILFAQLHSANNQTALHLNDGRGARLWIPFHHKGSDWNSDDLAVALKVLDEYLGKRTLIVPHGLLVTHLRNETSTPNLHWPLSGYTPVLELRKPEPVRYTLSPHLQDLEAESIHIIREAVAEAENPVMLYSLGKDSSVMLHLARKAFFPGAPPFTLMHIDTRWKFREMYLFRDHMTKTCGIPLIVHVNPEAIEKDINPFDHGSSLHTDITKTEGLKQALNQHRFDVIFGGARRDEEKSRAKERVFSFRNASHHWDPKQQRPELWNLYNTRKRDGESVRVFPLSNWTELDIWQYIHHQQIPIVPLYFAKLRPIVERQGMLLMVDDARFRLEPDDVIQERMVRFRTLGCYPLTGAVESTAASVSEIILELVQARESERQGRAIDHDSSASMEKKKQEGYF
jgi:sulfate adenylyltransferase subunit 2